MDSSSCIEQKGVIEEINKDFARVNITTFSACANCHSKKGCGMSETSEKDILVHLPDGSTFRVGETVSVIMKRAMGWKATVLAYFIPFTLVLTTLMILTTLNFHEIFAGLGALAILVPYFTSLYLMREKLKSAFTFTLRKV